MTGDALRCISLSLRNFNFATLWHPSYSDPILAFQVYPMSVASCEFPLTSWKNFPSALLQIALYCHALTSKMTDLGHQRELLTIIFRHCQLPLWKVLFFLLMLQLQELYRNLLSNSCSFPNLRGATRGLCPPLPSNFLESRLQ